MSRISKERMEKALEQLKTISPRDHAKVKAIANIVRPLRSFIFKTPDDSLVPSMAAIFSAFSELQGVLQYQELIDLELLKMGAFPAADMTPQLFASGVKTPVLMMQVRNDSWTRNPEDDKRPSICWEARRRN